MVPHAQHGQGDTIIECEGASDDSPSTTLPAPTTPQNRTPEDFGRTSYGLNREPEQKNAPVFSESENALEISEGLTVPMGTEEYMAWKERA